MAGCVEKKITWSGCVQEFHCELLHLENGFGVLKHVIDRPYTVSDLELRPGDVTLALYWTGRPYTLYLWQLNKSTCHYFNVAETLSLTPKEFVWRDLIVDIVIADRTAAVVLDEDELPAGMPSGLRLRIDSIKKSLLANYPVILREVDRLLAPVLLA